MNDSVAASNFSSSWTRVDQTNDPSFYVGLLEATRAQLIAQASGDPAGVFGPLGLRAGLRVLDVGCGTGDYLRVMAPLVAPGEAVGVDLSATLIARAREQTDAEQANVAFRVGDAYRLPFPDASFDRVIASQVLLHLADPWQAVKEMRRVLVPGGRLWIGEWDWDSTCLAVTDIELGRRFTHLLCDQMSNGRIIRDLDWRLHQTGFGVVDVLPEVRLSHRVDATFRWLIQPAARELARAGALTDHDAAHLLTDLTERSGTGRYFLARTYYTFIATAD